MHANLWAMYFASVVSFHFHPGNVDKWTALGAAGEDMVLKQCARLADRMLQVTLEREASWRGSDLQ